MEWLASTILLSLLAGVQVDMNVSLPQIGAFIVLVFGVGGAWRASILSQRATDAKMAEIIGAIVDIKKEYLLRVVDDVKEASRDRELNEMRAAILEIKATIRSGRT